MCSLIYISLILALVLSTSFIRTPVRATAVISHPGGTTRWDALITATFSGGSDDAIFGVRPDATSGFDNAYDIPEPPPPVDPPYLQTFFHYPGNAPPFRKLHKSCIPLEDNMEWPLRVSHRNGTDNITLSWNLENVPANYAVLLFEDENLVANMRVVDNYTFQTASGDFDFTIRVAVTVAWQLIETWTGTISAPAEWQVVETWTGTVSAPAAWSLIETWTGTISAPAEWQLIKTWVGAIKAPVVWQLIETWTGTVQVPPAWQLIETWIGPLLIGVVRGVEVSILPSYQSGPPGTTLSYIVTVTNTGNVEDNYLLSLVDNATWNPSIFPPSLTVPTGEDRAATLTVTIPENTALCTEDNITVIATSEVDNTVSAEDSCIAHAVERTVIYPVADVYAFGDENGYSRSQLKFDISSIPSRSNILSAKLWLYRFAADNWDGEILLNRVDDQPWSENITAAEFDAQTLTNEETRGGKFMSPGWDNLEVENQLNVDHEAGHAYSSYRLRWANDNGGEPSVGIDDNRLLMIASELDELSIIFSSSEYNGGDPYLEVVYFIPHGWYPIETWTNTIEAFAEWQIMESWTGTISAPIEWKPIETWTGTVSAPAKWQTVEIWKGTVKTPPAPAKWQTVEIWKGTVNAPPAPAKWELIKIWTGAVSAPVAAPPSKPSLISPADGTITIDNTPTFDWSDVTGAENYDLLVDNDADFSSPEIQVTVPVSTYTPTVGLPDDRYWWKVRARDAAGNIGDWSSTWTLTIRTIVRGVEVSISPESKSGAPGETLTYDVTVKNTGSIDDNYTLRAVGEFDWTVSIEPTSLTLDAGASDNATLDVIIPENAENGTSMTTTVSTMSVGDPTVTDSDTCRTDVTGVAEEPELELPIPLAISMVLIGAAVIVPSYLLHVRRKRPARRRVLRDVSLTLGAALLAMIYLLRGRHRAARRRVLREPRRLGGL